MEARAVEFVKQGWRLIRRPGLGVWTARLKSIYF
jgi:hypothetical protein